VSATASSVGAMTDTTSFVAELSSRVRGRVLTADADGYDVERTGFQRWEAHRPAVVVAATSTDDVREAVGFAVARRMPWTVQATGHGHTTPIEGMLITTRRMNGVRVDPVRRVAWVEAGATWREVIDAAAPHGLAPLSGSFPDLGAVAYTVTGGVGLLARRHGFTSDHVHRFDVVTPDGRLRHVSEHSEPELFWALRGGGGRVGVVTGMEIELVCVTRLFGGSLLFDVAQVSDVLEVWGSWTGEVDDDLTSAATVLTYPDVAGVPEPLRGRSVAHLRVAYCGSADEGRAVTRPLREIGPVLADTLGELPYPESGSIFDEPEEPHPYRGDNLVVRELPPEALPGLTAAAGPDAPVFTVVGVRHLGGALARSPRVPSAVGHRSGSYLVSVLSPVSETDERVARRHHDATLAPFIEVALGRRLGFAFRPLSDEELAGAFDPGDDARLRRIARELDPHGLLRIGHGSR
jgi:FAD/FMN-containing dehydrogenase